MPEPLCINDRKSAFQRHLNDEGAWEWLCIDCCVAKGSPEAIGVKSVTQGFDLVEKILEQPVQIDGVM